MLNQIQRNKKVCNLSSKFHIYHNLNFCYKQVLFPDVRKKFKLQQILFHLDKLLNRFNVLCCENIILPNTTEEVLEFKTILRDCDTLLKQISDPTQSDVLDDVVINYEEFVTVFNEIINVKKM